MDIVHRTILENEDPNITIYPKRHETKLENYEYFLRGVQ